MRAAGAGDGGRRRASPTPGTRSSGPAAASCAPARHARAARAGRAAPGPGGHDIHGQGRDRRRPPPRGRRGCDEAALQELLSTADVVLCVGTELGAETTGQYALRFGGQVIHLDAAPDRIGVTYTRHAPRRRRQARRCWRSSPSSRTSIPSRPGPRPGRACRRCSARIRSRPGVPGPRARARPTPGTSRRRSRPTRHRLGHDHPRLLGGPAPAPVRRPAVPVPAGIGDPRLRVAGRDRRARRASRAAGARR